MSLTTSKLGLTGVFACLIAGSAMASSHREAPAISKDPFADNTDTYVFLSPTDSSKLVLVASWIPFESPEGGPNYFEWDDGAEYKIHIDNDGDGESEWTYTLTSRVNQQNDETFLYNKSTIGTDGTNWNRRQHITVTETSGMGNQTIVNDMLTSPVNIGSKSTPNYPQYMSAATYTSTLGGDEIKVFAGQTDDPFFVDLQVFDLLTLRGQAAPIGYTNGNNVPVDSLKGYNTHTLVIELPVSRVLHPTNNDPVLGVWATTSRNSMQVSRLGMPLVNEVVIPFKYKDRFNTIDPTVDASVYIADPVFQKAVDDPELGNLLCRLYGVPLPSDADSNCETDFTEGGLRTGRGDIFDIYLQGMVLANDFTINTANGPKVLNAGDNINRPDSDPATEGQQVVPSEMIRINTNIKDDQCAPTPHPLGILGGDACGFPNGRRLADDVTDISLLAVGGAAYQALDGRDANFEFGSSLLNVLRDNVNSNDFAFSNTFPYVAAPSSGQERQHSNAIAARKKGGGAMSTVEIGLLAFLLLFGFFMLYRRKAA